MKNLSIALTTLIFSIATAACGGGGGGAASCTASERATYPSGSYGLTQGSTLADLSFTNPDGSTLTLSDVRTVDGNDLLFLTSAAGWCTACIDEQPTLESWHDTFGSRGLEVMVAVFEDKNSQPATPALASTWIQENQVSFTVVADPSPVLQPYYPNGDTSVAPLNLIVNLCNMEIIKLSTGVDTNANRAIIEARL